MGEWLDMTYGVDWNSIQPRTGGTITGRNENDDNITEIGAYVHTETALGDYSTWWRRCGWTTTAG